MRADNEWAKANMDKLHQNYLMSFPVFMEENNVEIDILKGYFKGQFAINSKDDSKKYWQVFDGTTGEEVSRDKWKYNAGKVTVKDITPWHKYMVNLLVYRIWEEMSN